MVLFKDEDNNDIDNENRSMCSDRSHNRLRQHFREEEDEQNCVIRKLCEVTYCTGTAKDEYRSLITLKYLREMELFYKDDITDMQLLFDSFCYSNYSIFQYLLEWNPTGLSNLNSPECLTLLQELIDNDFYDDFKPILKAGLKYLPPNELGLLLFTTEENQSPYASLMDEDRETDYGEKTGWTIIEESFEEAEDLKLQEPDPTTNLYPCLVAAHDQSCPCVDLVYYLLRKDPFCAVTVQSFL